MRRSIAGSTVRHCTLNEFTMLRFGPPSVEADGKIRLPIAGASGQRVKPQPSSNLVVWEDWQTLTLDGSGCELSDSTAGSSQRFYRLVEDRLNLAEKP